MGIIRLQNMQFYGYHGVSESEKHLGGKFEVDVEMTTHLNQAYKTDSLQDTIDYEAVYNTVDKCVKKDNYYLIEALANSIATDIIQSYNVEDVTIRVRKPHAPIRGVLDTVEVEINLQRNTKNG